VGEVIYNYPQDPPIFPRQSCRALAPLDPYICEEMVRQGASNFWVISYEQKWDDGEFRLQRTRDLHRSRNFEEHVLWVVDFVRLGLAIRALSFRRANGKGRTGLIEKERKGKERTRSTYQVE
jgi:hypothetical protein